MNVFSLPSNYFPVKFFLISILAFAVYSSFAFGEQSSLTQLMKNGDEVSFGGLSFNLIDDGGASQSALFELKAGNASGSFFAQKNRANSVLGVIVFPKNAAAGMLNVTFSYAQGQDNASNSSFPPALPSVLLSSPSPSPLPVEVQVYSNASAPQQVLACLQQNSKSLIIERHSRIYSTATGIVSVIEFKVKNNSSEVASPFVLKDDSGKQWAVGPVGAFEEKTFSFALNGPAPSEKPHTASVLVAQENQVGTAFAYGALLLLIGIELFVVKKFWDNRNEE